MRTEFTKFRDSSDQIHDATTAKILRVLDKKQRGRFEKLLGEPFDPSKLSGPGGFGGPGQPGAATTETKAARSPQARRHARDAIVQAPRFAVQGRAEVASRNSRQSNSPSRLASPIGSRLAIGSACRTPATWPQNRVRSNTASITPGRPAGWLSTSCVR